MTALYKTLANLIAARINCNKIGNADWEEKHIERMKELTKKYMPSGSGFDAGTTIDIEKSDENKLTFHTSYHHMNDVGTYDGWTEHDVIIKPSLTHDFTIDIKGRNRNDIKEYIEDEFYESLRKEIDQ